MPKTGKNKVRLVREYQVVKSDRVNIAVDVGRQLRDGWEYVGGVCVCDGFFYQAMTRWVEAAPPPVIRIPYPSGADGE